MSFKNKVDSKFKTTMIYPLSQFEEAFGYLWGHGKHVNELTPEEKANREKWEHCRKNILDTGNFHKREVLRAMDAYDIRFVGYKARFVRPEDLPENYGNRKEDYEGNRLKRRF